MSMRNWEYFNELFDAFNGGALYISDNDDGTVSAAGVLWLDSVQEDQQKPYYAFEAVFDRGEYIDGVEIIDKFSSADAFNGVTDPYVATEIGWYDTIDEATEAVREWCGM